MKLRILLFILSVILITTTMNQLEINTIGEYFWLFMAQIAALCAAVSGGGLE